MHTINLTTVIALVLVYAGLFVVIRAVRSGIPEAERKTAWVIGLVWAVSVFVANYVLFRLGLMSFLPWLNNFMHTFLWIGVCLTFLYLAVRGRRPMFEQFVVFATFSLVVKYAEQLLFGTWEHDHFFHVFQGNTAYVVGWSLADGLYPMLTLFGLRLLAPHVAGLKATSP